MKNRKLKSALRAVRRDWYVFPLHGVQDGKCACADPDCDRAGKHPLTAHGFKDATRDAAQIRDWWNRWPTANLGIVTGKAGGLVVLDIDLRHRGIESLKELERQYQRLPIGPCVRTGSGGEHRYFSHPGFTVNSKIGLRPGVDLRGDGGYVVGAGSDHLSGNRYLWKYGRKPSDIGLPAIPLWLLELVCEQKPTRTQSEKSIPEGLRNSTLASLGGAMRSRGMTHEAIEAALLEDNRRRCDPPLQDAEVIAIARSISQYAPGSRNIVSASSYEREEAERKLLFRTGKEIAKEAAVEVPWISSPWVAAGAITEVDGKVKLAGKTTFLTHLVCAVLDGSSFLGEPTSQSKVIYLTEQGLTTFRIAMERAGLLGRPDFTVLFWTDTAGMSWPSVVCAAVAESKRRRTKLLVVDTLPQFAGLPGDAENLAGSALEALKPLQLAAAEGLAIVIVRHERKSGGSVGDSGRGSSAFAGAVDIVLSIRRPEGNQPRNVRLIQTLSRFDAPEELLVELTEEGYRSIGAPGEAAKERQAVDVLSAIPNSEKNAATFEDLSGRTGKKRAHLQRLLDALAKDEKISRLGEGRKGDPFRYFRH